MITDIARDIEAAGGSDPAHKAPHDAFHDAPGWRVARAALRGLALLCLGMAAGLALATTGAGGGGRAVANAWGWFAGGAVLLWVLQFAMGRRLMSGLAPGVLTAARRAPGAGVVADIPLPAVIGAFPDPCVAVDRRGVVLAASLPAVRLFPNIVAGRPLSFVLRAPEFVDALETALNDGVSQTVLLTHRVPVERLFEIGVAPLDSVGRRGALVVLHDLTAQRRVEQMRVDFIANASHELRTPLATVLGFIETLQGPARSDPAARERFLEIMRDQSLRMKRLIDDLLSLSRIEARAHLELSGPVDVVDVTRQITDALRPMATEAGVEINLDAPEDAVIVPGDRDELLRVVENLVENAVKYGDSGKRVDVSVATRAITRNEPGAAHQDVNAADAPSAEVIIEVRDYGPGIPPEHTPRLTERFYRVDAQASRGKGGSGLGLAIVRHIVNHHRGRLNIESVPGEGSVFRVILPLAQPTP